MMTVVRSDQRIRWRNSWLDSRQSFPATGNFDLAANAHGLLLIHNEDTVDPGEGFDTHHHQDMEIVTWVLEGTVVHEDSTGSSGSPSVGTVQRMSAGTGVVHSERNGAGYRSRERVRVVQMWVPPDHPGGEPSYEEADVGSLLSAGALVAIAGVGGAVSLGNSSAALHIARLVAGRSVVVPVSPYGHVFMASGSAVFGDVSLQQGDAVRLTDSGGQTVTALDACEVMIWEMHARA